MWVHCTLIPSCTIIWSTFQLTLLHDIIYNTINYYWCCQFHTVTQFICEMLSVNFVFTLKDNNIEDEKDTSTKIQLTKKVKSLSLFYLTYSFKLVQPVQNEPHKFHYEYIAFSSQENFILWSISDTEGCSRSAMYVCISIDYIWLSP